jgi:uncharacterized protein (DUF58 family)
MSPSPRLLVILAAGLAVAALPTLVDVRLWLMFAGMWVVLLAALGWDLGRLLFRRPRVDASVPTAVGVGDDFCADLAVTCPASATLGAIIRGEAEAPLEAIRDVVQRLPPGDSHVSLPLRANRRGAGALQAVWLRFDGPLGLLHRVVRVPVTADPIQVIPSVQRVHRFVLEHFGASRFESGAHVERFRGEGGEFDALEGYAPGMDLRNVDWKASARHWALRVRRFRLETNQRVILCVDTGRLMADPIEDLQRLDHAVHAALVVAVTALRGGDLVGLHAYGASPHLFVPPAPGTRHFRRLQHAAAALRPGDSETNHFLGLRDLMTRLQRRSLVIVFTEFTDATMAQLMIENLAHIARRHLVLFVALDDPVTEQPLHTRPQSVEGLAEAVVAGELSDARALVLKGLERSGVEVVHGPPSSATLQLLSRYVQIKRRRQIG